MARNTQLTQLVNRLRAEVAHSQSAALGQNAREGLIGILQGRQQRLYEEHDWPHLIVDRDITLAAGSRTYGFPSDMVYERIKSVSYRASNGGKWLPVTHGIGDAQMNATDSDALSRGEPVKRWEWRDPDMLEVWPIPIQNGGTLRLNGVRALRPLIADSDRADLDDTLIILYSAARILARQKSPDAGQVLEEAKAHYRALRGQPVATKQTFIMGAHDPDDDCLDGFVHNRELTIQ